jgi:hypothetical protein
MLENNRSFISHTKKSFVGKMLRVFVLVLCKCVLCLSIKNHSQKYDDAAGDDDNLFF